MFDKTEEAFMIDSRTSLIPRFERSSLWAKGVAGVSAFAAAIALGACTPEEEPKALPGERLAVVRVTTIPPGLTVRILSEVIANPPARVEKLQLPVKRGSSPQEVALSYEPGFGTQMIVRAFLSEAPKPGAQIILGCEVLADGQVVHGAEDIAEIAEYNQQTEFALCVFNENLAPPA